MSKKQIQPIEEHVKESMSLLATLTKEMMPNMGFAIFVFPFESGISNYISNANRDDMCKMLHETLQRFEYYKTIENVSKPKIICLCGSMKFKEEFRKEELDFSCEGNIVLTPLLWMNVDNIKFKELCDNFHKRKIDLCDEVFVINKDGYIGESTTNEINYAKSIGKPINYLESL